MDRKRYLKDYLKTYRTEVQCLNLTVPKDEYLRLKKAADSQGLKPGRLIVEIALREVDNAVYVPDAVMVELQAIRFLIRNIANNLNQIAHHTNAVRRAADERAVFAELQRLELAVADYTAGRLAARSKPNL